MAVCTMLFHPTRDLFYPEHMTNTSGCYYSL